MLRRQRPDMLTDVPTEQRVPTSQLAVGNVVMLDCISSKGAPCQTDLVVARVGWGRTPKLQLTVSSNNSRAPLNVGSSYLLEDPRGLGMCYGAPGMIGVDQYIPLIRPGGRGIRRTSFVVGLTIMSEESVITLGDTRERTL